MSNLKIDIIEGHAAEYKLNTQGIGGWTVTRRAILSDVPGIGAEKIYNAVNDAAMPNIGDVHPNISGAYLHSISAPTIEGDQVTLSLNYGPFNYSVADYEISGVSSQKDTNLDIYGNEVWVSYTYPSDYIYDENLRDVTDFQGATYSKHTPEIMYRVTKDEALTHSQVYALAKNYVGKVNAYGWGFDMTALVGDWLCVEINGRKTGFSYYRVTYTFIRRPQFVRNAVTYAGWCETLVYIDSNTGKPPDPDTWGADTLKIILPYETANFDALGL